MHHNMHHWVDTMTCSTPKTFLSVVTFGGRGYKWLFPFAHGECGHTLPKHIICIHAFIHHSICRLHMLFFESLTQPSTYCSYFRFKGLTIYSDSYQQIFEKFQNIKTTVIELPRMRMCLSIASFHLSSELQGWVPLNSGTLNTAPRLFHTGLVVIPFVYSYFLSLFTQTCTDLA